MSVACLGPPRLLGYLWLVTHKKFLVFVTAVILSGLYADAEKSDKFYLRRSDLWICPNKIPCELELLLLW